MFFLRSTQFWVLGRRSCPKAFFYRTKCQRQLRSPKLLMMVIVYYYVRILVHLLFAHQTVPFLYLLELYAAPGLVGRQGKIRQWFVSRSCTSLTQPWCCGTVQLDPAVSPVPEIRPYSMTFDYLY